MTLKEIPETTSRSEIMRAVRSKDTKPEMLVRRLVHKLGYRFRLHRHDIVGTPDLAFIRRHKLIFVHGCWWHGHSCKRGARVPKTRQDYWLPKIAATIERDKRNTSKLKRDGWDILTIWECETTDATTLQMRLRAFLD
jgi:DNA mismatch endonuclease (patch repair protein)